MGIDSGKSPLRTELLLELLGVIVLICFIGSELSLLRDPGVGWHLKTGEWIARNRSVPSSDPFLLTSAGKAWICNQWLADLFFWAVNSIGGLATVQATAILICILPFLFLLPQRLRHYSPSAPAMLLTMLGCMGMGLVQWYVRPVIFSFFLFGLVYKLLWSRCRYLNWRAGDFFLFPAIFLLWANLHPGFPLGLILFGIALWDSIVRLGVRTPIAARIIAVGMLSAAATVVNPFGFALHRAIFGLVSSDYFMALNTEWQSPNFHNPLFYPFIAALFLCITAPKGETELLPFEKIAFGIFVLFGFSASRYVPFLGVAAATPLVCAVQGYLSILRKFTNLQPFMAFVDPAERVRFPIGVPTAALGALLLFVTSATGTIPGWKPENLTVQEKFPAEIAEILKSAPAGARVFHTPNWGGYFTWSLWPAQRAWIDDRNELNGKDLYEDFFTIVRYRDGWRAIVEKHGFNFLLLEKDSAIYTAMKSDNGWRSRFENEAAALFERVTDSARTP